MLGRVISSLVKQQQEKEKERRAAQHMRDKERTFHIPYRDSRLTFLLQVCSQLAGWSKHCKMGVAPSLFVGVWFVYCRSP